MSTGPNADSSSSRRSPDQTVFGRFILRRLLGQGGTGEVWLAHDEKLEQDVALKFFSGAILGHATRHSLRLTHPNIVRIYDFVEDGHDAAISMEYVEGWSLWAMKVERPHQCFTVEEIEPWIRQLCAALEYAHHSADLVHRDLKPANLIINSRSQLKVTDFGIARNLSGAVGQLTAALPPLGTLGHISPQQTMGSEPSVLDDIYSLGATIYELLTGHPPFYKGEVLAQVQQLTPPSMTERRHELGVPEPARLPLSWEQTVAACLEKDPGRRPQSIAAVLQQLFPEVQPLPEPAVPVETDAIPAGGSRKLIFALVGVALAGVLLIAAVIYFLRPFSPRAHASITPASPTRPGAPNPAGEILATSIYLGADDFVVDVFHNGQRVPNAARSMTTEQYGAIGERTVLTLREGDWVVFNVANNRLRWGGSYYFGAAGVRDDKSIGFVSEESEQWSVCEEPGLVPRFIAEPLFLATNLARRIEKPWGGGDGMIKGRVKNWHGYAIWGSAENRNIWIKFYAKPAGK